MSLTSRLRAAAFARLPGHWQPPASYHYYRLRSLLEPELALACRRLRAGDRAIDVGANEGVYTHAFAVAGATVEAFEPNPECAAVLDAYAQARGRGRVTVHRVALGAGEGNAMLHVPVRGGRAVAGRGSLDAGGGELVRHAVEVRALDAFGFTNVRVIKVDVEGRELDVLRGAADTVARCRPLLLVEIEARHLPVPMPQAFAEITALGYTGSFLLPGHGLVPLERFEPDAHQPPANADRVGALYVNNFVFRPVEERAGA